MTTPHSEALFRLWLQLSCNDQIHIAIARECQTQRGRCECKQRYSAERIAEHNEWVKTHAGLLDKFKLKGEVI